MSETACGKFKETATLAMCHLSFKSRATGRRAQFRVIGPEFGDRVTSNKETIRGK